MRRLGKSFIVHRVESRGFCGGGEPTRDPPGGSTPRAGRRRQREGSASRYARAGKAAEEEGPGHLR